MPKKVASRQRFSAAALEEAGRKRAQHVTIRRYLTALDQRGPGFADLEEAFIAVAADWAERKRISYAALREVGVPARVLREAGVPRTRLQ